MAVQSVLLDVDLHHELYNFVSSKAFGLCARLTVTRLLLALAFVSIVSYFIRYRFLNVYARLPQEPQRKEPQIDLFPDSQDGDSKPGLSNYLDEFFSAIKVFGYLERPVFHELTRTMQTRKLMAGETLLLEEEKGFCLVVDGLVQIFVKSLREATADAFDDSLEDGEQYHEGNQGYQLLTEVRNGASMSSLFSILSLFTEDVRLRLEDEIDSSSSSFQILNQHTSISGSASPLDFSSSPQPNRTDYFGTPDKPVQQQRLPPVTPLALEPAFQDSKRNSRHRRHHRHRMGGSKSAHPDIVARAMVDTTIAIIPASAFRRLTRVYPRATAHIVQVILSRLQRVTLSTAHSYLGLTTEVLQIEKFMNKYTSYEIPNHLRGDALDRLKEKFVKDRERAGPEEVMKGIALHNPTSHRRRSSSSLRKEVALSTRLSAARRPYSENHNISPGDLVSNIQPMRRTSQDGRNGLRGPQWNAPSTSAEAMQNGPTSPLTEHPSFQQFSPMQLKRQDSINEDVVFRDSVLACLLKALGMSMTEKNSKKQAASVEQSPRLVSYDHMKQTAIFNNAFGFMDPYEGEGDSESGISISAASATGSLQTRNLSEELIDDVEIVFFPKDSVLVEQGERNPGVYYVIDGFLEVSIPGEQKDISRSRKNNNRAQRKTRRNTSNGESRARLKTRKSLYLIKPGGIAGYIGTLSSYRSFTDVTAKTDVYVGFLPRAALERVAEKYPLVLLTMAKRLTSLLPRLMLHIDFALEWIHVPAGQVIYHQGDESDSIYIVLNGRLRSVQENDDGAMRVTGEFGQGESIGELEVMTESPRPANLHAIRDTELARIPRSLFNSLAQEHPSITIQISKLIAQRMRVLTEDPLAGRGLNKLQDQSSSSMNLRTVAILPITSGIPVSEFGNRLLTAFTQVGVPNGATLLNQATVLGHLGRHAFSRMGKLKLSQYLADLEEKYGMVLYVADTNVNAPWTQTCISQADCILLVGLAEASPTIGEYERFLLGMKTTARKDLVLLHVERYSRPGLTRKWLRNRVWINGGHHHIQMAFRPNVDATPAQPRRIGTAIKQRVQVIQAEIQKYTSRRVRQTPMYSPDTPFKGDFHRLARRLSGKSVGLVLGGGGARGISEIGVIHALEEAGIPIDIIGGTSMGAFIGALYARDVNVVPMYGRAKKFAGRMGSLWRFALDLTYPSASYTTGHEFNRGIFKTFGDSQIEDFWLPFYCNTTNISKSRAEIHTSGYAWRYVRASMSLAGLIPPMCDEGSMLLDGGYIDNLTVAHMKSLGADVIFAVDVGALDDETPQNFGDSLSGFWAAWNRWNPFSLTPNPPTLSEIQARLAYVSSVDALERAKTLPGCLHLRPPIDAYGTLEFGKFDEIYEVGYAYTKEFLRKLKEDGSLNETLKWAGTVEDEVDGEEGKRLRRTMAPRRASI